MSLIFILYVNFFDSLILNLIKDYGPIAGPCIGAIVGAFFAFIFYNINAEYDEKRKTISNKKKVVTGLITELEHILTKICNPIKEFNENKEKKPIIIGNDEKYEFSVNEEINIFLTNLKNDIPFSLNNLIYFQFFNVDLSGFSKKECSVISDFFYDLHDYSLELRKKLEEILSYIPSDSQKREIEIKIGLCITETKENMVKFFNGIQNQDKDPNLNQALHYLEISSSSIYNSGYLILTNLDKRNVFELILENLKNSKILLQSYLPSIDENKNNLIEETKDNVDSTINMLQQILYGFSKEQWELIKDFFSLYIEKSDYLNKEITTVINCFEYLICD